MKTTNKLIVTTIGGCLSLLAFGYLSYKAYPKIEEIKTRINKDTSTVKKIKIITPVAAPPIAAGLCSIGFQILGCRMATNTIKGLEALVGFGFLRATNSSGQNKSNVYYDIQTGEEFVINDEDFLRALYQTQIKLISDTRVNMNYWRKRVGLPETTYGSMHGWDMWYYWEHGLSPVININVERCITDKNIIVNPVYFGKDLVNIDLIRYGEEETSK